MPARTRPGGPDTTSGAPKKSDTKTLKAQARRADQQSAEAYDLGRADAKAGHPKGHRAPFEPHLEELYNAGYDEHGQASKRSPDVAADAAGTRPAPAATPATPAPSGGSIEIADQGASFLLGVLAYALVLSYLRYGWPGVTGWLSAKFLNRVTLGGVPTTGVPGTPPGSLNLPPTKTPNPNPGVGSNMPIATAPSGQPIYGYIQP